MQNLENKICLITGATSGIGKATAIKLAEMNASIILLGRNITKGKITIEQIKRKTKNEKLIFYEVDLSLMQEVKKVSEEIKSDYNHIDILVNNAGARFLTHVVTKEGIEYTFALNHLSYFLLTNLLIALLECSESAKIINVSSGVHHYGDGVIENIIVKDKYNGKRQYSNSKLANILFTYELSNKLKNTKISVNAVDPGGVATNFARNNGWINWKKHRIYYLIKGKLLTPSKGSETIIYLATSPEVEEITGKYFKEKKQINSSKISYNANTSKELWNLSEKLTYNYLGLS
jgi:NAD(P)-dependent dehydrogenase (short-subunit alcohol dehydrogenase family)